MVEMFFDSHKARQTRRPHGTLRPSTPHQRQTTRPHGHNQQPQTPIDQTIHVPRERGCESRGRRWQNGIGGDGGGSGEGDSGEGEGTTRADEAEARAVAPNSTAGSLERHRPPASPAATTMSLIPNLPASSCRCARRQVAWPTGGRGHCTRRSQPKAVLRPATRRHGMCGRLDDGCGVLSARYTGVAPIVHSIARSIGSHLSAKA